MLIAWLPLVFDLSDFLIYTNDKNKEKMKK